MNTPAILALEDGTLFHGRSLGAAGLAVGEVCFNTNAAGYASVLTDPAYRGLLVAMTYPHVGNVGMSAVAAESAAAQPSGLIARDLSLIASSWRAEQSLQDYLVANGVVAIDGIDTRKLTRLLREGGAQRGCIMVGAAVDPDAAVAQARGFAGLQGRDLVAEVSTAQPYQWLRGSWQLSDGVADSPERDPASLPWHVVVLDLGVRRSLLRQLVDAGCRLTVLPARTSVAEIQVLQPHGLVLAGGPGDPAACGYAIDTVRQLLAQDLPILGMGLGHSLLALACGASTFKMKLGRHGANYPVQDLVTKRVEIVRLSYGFAVDEATLPAELQVTHRSLFDHSLQGFRHGQRPVLGFQGEPVAGFDPRQPAAQIASFLELMAAAK